jgi:hypothetical protein
MILFTRDTAARSFGGLKPPESGEMPELDGH